MACKYLQCCYAMMPAIWSMLTVVIHVEQCKQSSRCGSTVSRTQGVCVCVCMHAHLCTCIYINMSVHLGRYLEMSLLTPLFSVTIRYCIFCCNILHLIWTAKVWYIWNTSVLGTLWSYGLHQIVFVLEHVLLFHCVINYDLLLVQSCSLSLLPPLPVYW
jgi:hypothetical protein